MEPRTRALVEASKKAILDGISINRNLSGKVLTGGNLDAFKSLQIADKMRSEMINPPLDDILIGDWKESEWFGSYFDNTYPWVYHFSHGWLYLPSLIKDEGFLVF